MEYIPESTQKHIDDLVKTINRLNNERNKLTSENRALKEQLNLNPSSLHVKEKSTPTFEDWIKENKIETKNFGYIYKKKYYTVKNLYHKYEKEMAEL